ncbi:MAG: hypothetical protein IIY71_00205 [Oscillospiraceae bacterium]|nr:hypothetical protein [Oscillospiraceae bacterium]
MRKKGLVLLAMFFAALILGGCSTSKSFTFRVETGENVKVTLDTTNGLDLRQSDGQFTVVDKEGNALLDGMFLLGSMFEHYAAEIPSMANVTVNDARDDFIYWDYTEEDGSKEHNRALKLSDNTGVIIGSLAEKAAGEEAYQALSFEIVE